MPIVQEVSPNVRPIPVPAVSAVGTMKAAVYKRYGEPRVVEIATVPKPRVTPGTLLVKVRATTVTSGDWRLRSSTFPRGLLYLGRLALGVFGPRHRILGAEFSGDVE